MLIAARVSIPRFFVVSAGAACSNLRASVARPFGTYRAADTWLGLREKQSEAHPVPYDRYAVGVHHIAFEASTRDAVDQCWEWVLKQGVETESAPKEFPHYVSGYYAALFYDPDGIKLEVVHEPTRAATTAI